VVEHPAENSHRDALHHGSETLPAEEQIKRARREFGGPSGGRERRTKPRIPLYD
jgi:hypothetical protein